MKFGLAIQQNSRLTSTTVAISLTSSTTVLLLVKFSLKGTILIQLDTITNETFGKCQVFNVSSGSLILCWASDHHRMWDAYDTGDMYRDGTEYQTGTTKDYCRTVIMASRVDNYNEIQTHMDSPKVREVVQNLSFVWFVQHRYCRRWIYCCPRNATGLIIPSWLCSFDREEYRLKRWNSFIHQPHWRGLKSMVNEKQKPAYSQSQKSEVTNKTWGTRKYFPTQIERYVHRCWLLLRRLLILLLISGTAPRRRFVFFSTILIFPNKTSWKRTSRYLQLWLVSLYVVKISLLFPFLYALWAEIEYQLNGVGTS